MKTCTLCVMILLSSIVFNTSQAQVRACVFCASNVSDQPSWGPSGYSYVYYYYIPDLGVYYYVPDHVFIYQKQGVWITSATLPLKYAAFDFYRSYKVVINDPEPYLQHEAHKVYYEQFKGRRGQAINRDSEQYKQVRREVKSEKRGVAAL